MKIDSYQFGVIRIEGREYTSDVVIYPDRVKSDWWRKSGHKIQPEDVAEIVAEKPEAVVIGTGMAGVAEVVPETKRLFQSQGITLIVEDTKRACETYNRLSSSQRVVAALHLTC